MTQSHYQVWIHVIFHTRNRQPFLHDRQVRKTVFAYLGGICRNCDSPAAMIGGTADHVHILCRLSRTIAIADLARNLKRSSTRWVKRRWPRLQHFSWQAGYGAFSVAPRDVDRVIAYIANQEVHHGQATSDDGAAR